jgi:hypothetical protein
MTTLAQRSSSASPALSRADASEAGAHAWLGLGLLALGIGLAASSLIGPLVADAIDFHVTETLLNQMIGLDAVSLVVVAPLSVVAGVLVLRRHAAGPPVALAVGAYTAYMLVQYILGPDYLGLPGDSQVLFPLYLALFTLGWGTALAAWNAVDVERLPRSRSRDRLVGGVVLPLLGFLALFR